MKINIYIIDKKSKNDLYSPLVEHYKKLCSQFAQVEIIELFSNSISKAQETNISLAQKSYSMAFDKYLQSGFNISLNPSSKELDSIKFSELFKDKLVVNFFIGGAFGLERAFLDKSNLDISFGKITLSHKLFKVVLMEQIFRGLSIINNHPYHK
ncbi:MAG: 23S rRNA (pseudouridine(1915)-N(3))-methyltransferase RlmH [Epsilonproteobacteria bacterium]|nr:23S rRNA (pseudouridine(1915)-N(3))-methyltransferase RlmH [Campylobacterota bacterium]